MRTICEGGVAVARKISLMRALPICACLLVGYAPAQAQGELFPESETTTGLLSRPVTTPEQQGEQHRGTSKPGNAFPQDLPQKLGLSARQVSALDDIYCSYLTYRLERERRMERLRSALPKAPSARGFGEPNATSLQESIAGAQRDISQSFSRSRLKALDVLSAAQRLVLDRYVSGSPKLGAPASDGKGTPEKDGSLVRDAYFQLLLMPEAEILRTPVDVESSHRWQTDRHAMTPGARVSVFEPSKFRALGYGYAVGSNGDGGPTHSGR